MDLSAAATLAVLLSSGSPQLMFKVMPTFPVEYIVHRTHGLNQLLPAGEVFKKEKLTRLSLLVFALVQAVSSRV